MRSPGSGSAVMSEAALILLLLIVFLVALLAVLPR
jgi:hypothetical protein